MQDLIIKANNFISENRYYRNSLPSEISAPVMASFTFAIIDNDLKLSKEELLLHVKEFIHNESLEEFFNCIDVFAEATEQFASSLIGNNKESKSIHC